MKKSLIFFLVFIFITLSHSGEMSLPKIKNGEYDIEYRKGRTFFVDFTYVVDIQGTGRTFDGWLKVVLENKQGEEIESFGRRVHIESDSLQTFAGRRMIMIKVVKQIERVVFDLGIPQKKY